MFKLQTRSKLMCRNEGYESLSEGKLIERKMEKDMVGWLIEMHRLMAKSSRILLTMFLLYFITISLDYLALPWQDGTAEPMST